MNLRQLSHITDAVNNDELIIDQVLAKLFDELPEALEGVNLEAIVAEEEKPADSRKKDSLVGLLVGGALAAPKVSELLGKTAKWVGGKLNSEKLTKTGEAIEHFGHDLHHKYIKGIEALVRKAVPNDTSPETITKIATGIFYTMVALAGGAGAVGVGNALSGGNAALAVGEGALTGIKAGEIFNLIKGLLPDAIKATLN